MKKCFNSVALDPFLYILNLMPHFSVLFNYNALFILLKSIAHDLSHFLARFREFIQKYDKLFILTKKRLKTKDFEIMIKKQENSRFSQF